jgi:hypothetical protein
VRSRRATQPANYTIGYRRPPKATQFEKGVSGNPRGRPKGSRTVGAVLQDILRQKIAVTENGRTRRLPALEVVLRRLANDAMRGDARALKLLLALYDRYGGSPETNLRIDEILVEDREILANFLNTSARSTPSKNVSSGKKRNGV